jgi:hypothetical protein
LCIIFDGRCCNDGGKNGRNYHLDDALEQINQSEYGAHHLIVYPNQRVLRELYTKYVKTQLERENKTVLILPHYETTESLRNLLLDDSLPADMVKKYKDSLIVMDSINGHFGANDHMVFVNKLVDSAENGVLVIALSLQNIFFGHFSRILRRL